MKQIIEKIKSEGVLTRGQAKYMQKQILQGEVETEVLLELFSVFDARKPLMQVQEMLGIVEASRQSMIKVKTENKVVDLVGTGGDGIDSFNITTAASLVVASLGVQVAKHGNRSATSICGSADLLEEIGVKIDLDAEQASECLAQSGIVFLYAPNFHPAFRHAVEARKAYGKRTYFNFLGPLVNPAETKYQLVGVADVGLQSLMGEVLAKSGSKSSWLVTSEEGMDEISISSKTIIRTFPNNEEIIIDPEGLGIEADLEDIQIKHKLDSIEVFLNIINGSATPEQISIVALNAAAALVVADRFADLEEAYEASLEAILSRSVRKKLDQFIQASNDV